MWIELLGVEIRTENADDDVPNAAERDCLAHNPRIAAEPPTPQTVAQDHDKTSVGPILVGRKRATVEQRCAEQPEELRRDARDGDVLGLGPARQIHELEAVGGPIP